MRLFPFTLKEKAKEWFRNLAQEFNSWSEMETIFIKKYYSPSKTTTIRELIREFTQGLGELFYEAWERL